jgi:glycosyltransferase involved in cell wall biosynthesis
MQEPLVSIILPVYNRKEYLDQAINSVLQQTYGNWELIIADDASAEDTKQFLQRYAAMPRIKIHFNYINLGLFANLNQAIRRSIGNYVLLLCSDDFLLSQCLEANLELMQKYPEADLLLSSLDATNIKGAMLLSANNFYYDQFAKQTKLLQPEQIVPLLLQYGSINGNITGMFFKKSLFDRVGGFQEDWRHAADWEWLYRVASCSSILISRVNVAVVRNHSQQLSVNNRINLSNSLEVSEVVQRLLADPRVGKPELAARWARHIMQFHLWTALKFAVSGHWSKALVIARAVDRATGFINTFWTMLRWLPQRWKVYRQKSFPLPPN